MWMWAASKQSARTHRIHHRTITISALARPAQTRPSRNTIDRYGLLLLLKINVVGFFVIQKNFHRIIPKNILPFFV